ncbi:MAG: DUF2791 family P-loop domain-containing protein [Chloroflexi bacterium]|nr:DUF2791 family P-loop domain-containing protein [Chloroflexota bacterium]
MNLSVRTWQEVIRRDYLEDYIRAGGASVKFAIGANEAVRAELRESLRVAAEENGYRFVFIDAAATQVHLIDKLFHAVARQIDWDGLVTSFLTRLLTEQGLALPAIPDDLNLTVMSELNDRSEPLFRNEVSRLVERTLLRDYEMSQAFRIAMIQLCQARLDPDYDPALAVSIKEWLRGELRLISAVKRALIFQKIARHNARHMLSSLAHWLTVAGSSGLVLCLDISRFLVTKPRAEREAGVYYSTPAALDGYEVLRQLVDATDELEYCFVGVIASPEFLSDQRRGLETYRALYFRIADEVRDRYQANPLASLARIRASD